MSTGTCLINYLSGADEEIATVLHEVLHLFGAPDHYNIDSAPSTSEINESSQFKCFSMYCIYGEKNKNSNVRENLTICQGCRLTILNHIQDNRNKLIP